MYSHKYNLLWLVFVVPTNFAMSDVAYARRVTTDGGSQASVPSKWKALLDPTTEEFWKEGNHTPDAGFLLWARNPTIENAKFYLQRMNAKRDRLHLMYKQQEKANKELIKAGIIADDYDFLSKTKSKPQKSVFLDQFTQVFFLFSPTCSHCKRQAKIFSGLQQVVPMQVGGQDLKHFEGLSNSVWASEEDIKKYVSKGVVPVLLVYDRQTNNMTSIKGVNTIAEIVRVVSLLRKEVKKK